MKRIYLEITNSCDLDCPFCSEPKGHSFMSLADIDRYTDEIRPYCGYIYLHVLGEPLLHPCIDEILDILERKDFRLQLVTNGVHLGEHPDLINHKCLRKLSVSLHAVDRLNIGTAYFRTVDELIERHGDTVLELRFFDPANLSGDTLGYLQSLKERYELLETGKKNSYEISKDVYVLFEGMFEWPDLKLPFISYEGKCHG
ncbi:MAG: radical SAM protein, partial [Erysipelotrichaceae bacterium]|nr:radical SAM protein [Erysipelotrichaceae bacterium]